MSPIENVKIGPSAIFTLAFVTLGPLKVLGPFAQRTHGLGDSAVRKIATRTFLIATMAVIVGGLAGTELLTKWYVSVAALEITAGLIFLLVALNQLMAQYEPASTGAPAPLPSSPTAAALALTFPTVLTPYGIAGVIVLFANSDSIERTLMIIGLLVVVMVLNYLAMLYARRILVGAVMIVLQVLGAVLAVIQAALAVQFIILGLHGLGVLSGT
ncbi:MAG TPA: MarC family protein [Gemmatimonadaceae bacterium]|nr:MarC family protein [Gemmatimonadaceae bacterium]